MSWGNSASGSAAQVKGTAATFGVTLAANDAGWANDATKSAHQAQARAAEKAITEIVDSAPEGSTFSISVSGSAGQHEGGSNGYVSVNYTVSNPLPASPAADDGEGPEA